MERNRQITGWRVIGTLGTALAIGLGVGAHLLDRQRAVEHNAYIDSRISDSCSRLEPVEDRAVCETDVAQYFGREN